MVGRACRIAPSPTSVASLADDREDVLVACAATGLGQFLGAGDDVGVGRSGGQRRGKIMDPLTSAAHRPTVTVNCMSGVQCAPTGLLPGAVAVPGARAAGRSGTGWRA